MSWIFKTEPATFSIDDLETQKTTLWDGVRNYQARNYLLSITKGCEVFIYHSSCKTPGVVGLAEVVETNVVDPTQFDSESEYFDPKAQVVKPRWFTVRINFGAKLSSILTRTDLASAPKIMESPLLKKGNRLSIIPIQKETAFWIKKRFDNTL